MEQRETQKQNQHSCYLIHVPIVIFHILQSYCHGKSNDYGKLIRCNRFLFHEVRRDTIQYIFHLTMNDFKNKKILEKVYQRILSVKNKSKQIEMNVNLTSDIDLFQEKAELFHQIQKIYVSGTTCQFNDRFNFSIFNGIQSVKLARFEGITIISEIKNIRELDISFMPQLKQIDCSWNKDHPLHKLTILGCSQLEDLPSLHHISELDLSLHPLNETIFHTLQSFFLSIQPILLSPKFSDLQSLCLCAVFPKDFNFELLCHIPRLELPLHLSRFRIQIPTSEYLTFPLFHGRFLSIEYFKLPQWNYSHFEKGSYCLPNLQELTMRNCIEIFSLPELPNVKNLTLIEMASLQSIPTIFPECRTIVIDSSVPDMKVLPQLPVLTHLTIYRSEINDLSSIDGQLMQEVVLRTCTRLQDISAVRNARNLDIYHAWQLKSFEGLDQSILSKENRICSFDYMAKNQPIESCRGLGNIGRLQLRNIPSLESLDGLHNIDQLRIENCSKLSSLASIYGNIHQSINISCCQLLKDLHGLEGIPIVRLDSLTGLESLDGLGHHKVLYYYYKEGMINIGQDRFRKMFPTIEKVYVID